MPVEDANRRKDRVINEARKVVENINAMSFLNLDDQQVHSLMMMREIARGVVNNKVTKVTKSDVKKALSSSIDKMVGSCKDVNTILSRIPCDGMDEEQYQSVSRMKEIASTIVARRAKVSSSRLLEPAYRTTAETVESKMALGITDNNDTDIGGIQRRLFESETEPVGPIEIDQSEGHDILMIDASNNSGNGIVQDMSVVNGGNELQIALTEGMMFDDVELVVETDLDDQNENASIINGMSEPTNEAGQNKAKKLALVSPLRLTVVWPYDGKITLEWVKDMMAKFELSSKKDPPSEFWTLMASDVADKLITTASSILSTEPNCVEVDCREGQSVVVVGDVEGQFHDLLNIFRVAGLPSDEQFYVFNGNYVDRGAWGLEAFLVLLALKVLMPNRVYLLRGNHETKHCTTMFGFEQEVKTKFGEDGEMVYQKCLECFKELPLASIISKCVYTTHGGLFRSTRVGTLQKTRRKRAQNIDLGSLEELSKVERTLIDAPEGGSSLLADILWSNPSKEDGLVENDDKQKGLSWGPDCTETFLKESNLKLIIRSHQSPDARAGQDDFGDLLSGYSEDHVGESGKLYTLFSAPDYPQYGEPKYNNEGAYAILKAPNFENPSFHTFKGVRPPKLTAYGSSSSQTSCPDWMLSKVDFEALGISNPPSWSVSMADNTGGTKSVEVLRAPSVEGLPLPSELQEPHKAAFEYLFELVAGLKYMLSTRASESRALESAMEVNVPNENEGEIILKENEVENVQDEKEEQSASIEMGECEVQTIVDEKEEVQEIPTEKEEKENEMETEEETQGQDGPSVEEEQEVVAEKEGLDVETEETAKVETETQNEEMETEKEKETEAEETETEKRETETEKRETETETENEEMETEKEKVTETEETETEKQEMETENEEMETEEGEKKTEKEADKAEMETDKEAEKDKEKEEEKLETVCETEKEGQDIPSGNEGVNVEGEKEEEQSVADEEHEEDVPKEKDEKLAEEAPKEKEEAEVPKKKEEKDKEEKLAEDVPEKKEEKTKPKNEDMPAKKEEKDKAKKEDVPVKKEEKDKAKKEDVPAKKEEKDKPKKDDVPVKKEEKDKAKKQAEEVPKKKEENDKGEKQGKDASKEKEEKAKGKKQAEDVPKEKEEKDHKRKKLTEDPKEKESSVDDKEVKKTYKKGGKRTPNEDEEQGKAKKHKAESKPKE